MNQKDKSKGKYLHYKGKSYDVLGEARDVNAQTEYIIYRQDYSKKNWWIRPKDMFFEKVDYGNEKKWRFDKIKNEMNISDKKGRSFKVKHTETGEIFTVKYERFYDQYFLMLENQHGEQTKLELIFSDDTNLNK